MIQPLRNLSSPVKVVLAVTLAAVIAGVFGVTVGNPLFAMILFVGLLVIGLLIAVYLALLGWLRQRKSADLGKSLPAAGRAAGVATAADAANLDDLIQKFRHGLETFRAAGKNLYSMPWYLIIGESGSGKTEAIRRCGLGFPRGLQDELQGVGGTVNMNWWFTNKAVILDTAGKMVFPEAAKDGNTKEWETFLRMLHKHRKNCPINGLLLVIPTDGLFLTARDRAEGLTLDAKIRKKAGEIARQLELIKQRLEVRFPVYLMVTKADLVLGFREFFATVDQEDAELQHQVFGWSKSGSLDEPFRPDAVETGLSELRDRLLRRRLGLLLDPISKDSRTGRRIDEVDALYTFPNNLVEQIGPALRRYLELIFEPDSWSEKEALFRGVYFTSSMQEGSELDEEIATLLGTPADSLQDGRIWHRERSYFLRDLFARKVVPEHGLVTRATHIGKMQMRRRAVLLGAFMVGVVALMAATWTGYGAMEESVGEDRRFWRGVSEALGTTRQERADFGIVRNGKARIEWTTGLDYSGRQPVDIGGVSALRVELPKMALERSRREIESPTIFRWILSSGNILAEERGHAFRRLYEDSVLRPLVGGAMAQIAGSPAEAIDWSADTVWTRALAELIALSRAEDASTLDLGPLLSLARAVSLDGPSASSWESWQEEDEALLEAGLAAFEGHGDELAAFRESLEYWTTTEAMSKLRGVTEQAVRAFVDRWDAYQPKADGSAPGFLGALETYQLALADLERSERQLASVVAQSIPVGEVDTRWRRAYGSADEGTGYLGAYAKLQAAAKALREQDVSIENTEEVIAAVAAGLFEPARSASAVLVAAAGHEIGSDAEPPERLEDAPVADRVWFTHLRPKLDTWRQRERRRAEGMQRQIEADLAELRVASSGDPGYSQRASVYALAADATSEQIAGRLTDVDERLRALSDPATQIPAEEKSRLERALVTAYGLLGHRLRDRELARLAAIETEWKALEELAAKEDPSVAGTRVVDAINASLFGFDPPPGAKPGKIDTRYHPEWLSFVFTRFADLRTRAANDPATGLQVDRAPWPTLRDEIATRRGVLVGESGVLDRWLARSKLEGLVSRYLEYWLDDAGALAHVRFDPGILAPPEKPGEPVAWTDLRSKISVLKVATINDSLARFAKLRRDALEKALELGLVEAGTTRFDRQQIEADRMKLEAGRKPLDEKCTGTLARWAEIGLSSAPRDAIFALAPPQFVNGHLQAYGELPTVPYWDTLIEGALRTIADESNRESGSLLARLQTDFARFPIVRGRPKSPDAPPLEADALKEAWSASNALVGVARGGQAKPGTIGAGDRVDNATINALLDALRGRELLVGKEAWIGKVHDVLTFLTQDPLRCTVSIPNQRDLERVRDPVTGNRVTYEQRNQYVIISDVSLEAIRKEPSRFRRVRIDPYSPKGFDTGVVLTDFSGGLGLLFFEADSRTAQPSAHATIDEPWWIVAAINDDLNQKRVGEGGNTLRLPFFVREGVAPGAPGQDSYALWLDLTFTDASGAPVKIPTAWPDWTEVPK